MATPTEIRDGSVVRLNGCRQEMVVEWVTDAVAQCKWLDFEMKPNQFPFPLAFLERVSW